MITWGLILCLLCGCATEKGTTKIAGGLPHVGRAAALPDLRVAAYGGGHSLDELLADAGVKSATGLEVDGAVGKDVLAYGQAAGYELQGDTLVPARKRPVAVPQELGSVPGSVNVGGMPVKLVDQGEVDRWRELGAVVHEAYATELLIVSVASSSSRELSGVLSGNGGVSVAYPAGTSWSGKANVVLTLNGSSVRARQICHPVLTSAPGAAATVHVGERIPVLLSKSTVSGGGVATTSVGSTIQYIQTGTEVTLQPARVSATQCRLVGKISVSEQVATVNGVPSTSERVLSVDHLVVMDAWTVLGRLDAAQRRHARSWIAVGGLWSESDDTFVVVARVVQVHRDTGLHGTESAGPGPVLRVVDSDKPAAVPGPGKPVKPSGVKDLPPGAVPVTPGGATSKVETPVGQEAAKSPEKPKPAVPSPR